MFEKFYYIAVTPIIFMIALMIMIPEDSEDLVRQYAEVKKAAIATSLQVQSQNIVRRDKLMDQLYTQRIKNNKYSGTKMYAAMLEANWYIIDIQGMSLIPVTKTAQNK